MSKKRFILVRELKPECVEDYKSLHMSCLKNGFEKQPKAMLDSGAIEGIVCVYNNISVIYIETELDNVNEVFSRLNQTESYKKWSKIADPFFAENTGVLQKVFDVQEMLDGTFVKPQ